MPLRRDDFVSKIVTDPKNPPNTLLLKGFVGASSEEGHIRLYLDNELSDYVEIPESSILYSQEIPADKSPIGGSYIWIQRDATVVHGPVVADRPKASFLDGRIMSAAAAVPKPLPPQTVVGPACGTIIDGCTDAGPKCPTTIQRTCPDPCTQTGPGCTQSGPNCPTRPITACPVTSCPTCSGPTCPAPACTQSGPNCPTTPLATCSGPNCPTTPEATCCGPNCPTFPANTICGPACPTHVTCPAPTCPTPCTASGPNCPPPTAQGTTCPAASCTNAGPQCPTTTGVTCVGPRCFPTEVGPTCVGPHCPSVAGPACP